jgi:diacylglycerol O-acyltransferase
MADTRRLDRLTASDLFLLLWDDYGWSTDIGGLAILDGANLLDQDGSVRIDAVRRHIEPRLQLVPRFRQLLLRPRIGLGWPVWVDAPTFELADHIRVHHPLAAPGDEKQLLEACHELADRPFDRGRPLWELWLLPGMPKGRVGAFLKLHHVLADGPAALAAFAVLLDQRADTPDQAPQPWTPASIPSAGELFRDNLRRRRDELRRGWSGVVHPRRTLTVARRVLPAWREVLAEKPAPRTSLNRPVGRERRLAVVRGRLDPIRRVAHARDAKVNDVVLAALAGGLYELLVSRGEDVHGLVQRAMVTISHHDERPGEAQGNLPGWMMVPLPVGEPDARRRLEEIAAATRALKDRARPAAGSGIFRLVAGQRIWYRMFPRQRSVNLVVSNVPGPPARLYLAGSPVLEVFPLLPPMGNLTLVVAALSYAGQFNITAAADRDNCPDVEVFTRGVRNALGELEGSVSGLESEGPAGPTGSPPRFVGQSAVGGGQSSAR